MQKPIINIDPKDWDTCIKVLKILKDNPLNNPDNELFGSLITKIHKKAKQQLRKQNRPLNKNEDIGNLKKCSIATNALSNTSLYSDKATKQSYTRLNTPSNCYTCNNSYELLHSHYHRLCPNCAAYNYSNRFIKTDLANRNVILTGGRIKVGYATALKLLRSNANLILTTRFPALALENIKKEEDYHEFSDRLDIFGLDLRNLSAVSEFITYYTQKYQSLDILINNAAQTIRYTDDYYAPLVQKEQQLLNDIKHLNFTANRTPILSEQKLLDSWKGSLEDMELNRFGQPIDNRFKTSWNSR